MFFFVIFVYRLVYLSFGKPAEQTGAVVIDAEGRHCSIIGPGCFAPQTEAQSLVGVWREK